MGLEPLCWLALGACGVHIAEEYLLDWPGWVRSLTGISISSGLFLAMNGAAMVLGGACAAVANRLPMMALALPALMLINATFFHVGGFLWTRGRFSPGLISAVVLFYPLGIWCFRSASRAGVLTVRVGIGSFLIAALLMAAPILIWKARQRGVSARARVE